MERRTFLRRSFAAVSGAIAVIVGIPAVRYLFDPLARSRKDGAFIRVLPLSALVPGKPVRAAIIADRRDAFTQHPPGTIGQVFLVREADSPHGPSVRCLQVICPHFGCAIDYLPDRVSFGCPCHTSDFALDGHRRFGPAPRDMDPLECRITPPDPEGRQWVEVKYQEFRTGIGQRVART